MERRRVLGKGLDALIPKKVVTEEVGEFTYLPLDVLVPGPYQPRQEIEERELKELADSIRSKGVIQPIVVRKKEGGVFEIVAGARRFYAAKSLGLKEIPTLIKDLDDRDTFVFAIVENIQRKDLNPIEEAVAFKRLMEEFGFKLDDIARFIGKDKTSVANTLRLLKLPSEIQEALRRGLISRSQARTILAETDPRRQHILFTQILKQGLSVRELEEKVRKKKRVFTRKVSGDPFVQDMEERLQKKLGTKVKILHKRNDRGKIVIEYYGLKDLERITQKFI